MNPVTDFVTHYDANDDHQLLSLKHLDFGDIDSNGLCAHGLEHCHECCAGAL